MQSLTGNVLSECIFKINLVSDLFFEIMTMLWISVSMFLDTLKERNMDKHSIIFYVSFVLEG